MSRLEQFDLDQLLLNIHGELSQLMTESVSVSGRRLKIEQLNFRMGQRLKPGQENALESGRYPSEENWQVELYYQPGRSGSEAGSQAVSVGPDQIIDRIGRAPITVVKGVNTFWARRWKEEYGLTSLADLFNFSANRFWQNGNKPASQMIGHYSQLRQLAQNYLPFWERSLYHKQLALFWRESSFDLKSKLTSLSEQQIFSYQQQSWGMATALDLSFVQSLSLAIWAPPE
jgi:hypothetical protein